MKHKNLLILLVALFPLLALFSCQSGLDQFQNVSSTSDFAVSLVPNTNIDVYLYAKQTSLTTIPSALLNTPTDIQVESLAIWGVQGDKNMTFGMGLTFSSGQAAADMYNSARSSADSWKFLRRNNVYVVTGSGGNTEQLKTAILKDDFKTYKNSSLFEAANWLPKSVRANMIGVAAIKPGKQITSFFMDKLNFGSFAKFDEISKLANIDMVIVGLYSPHQINIARALQVIKGDGKVADIDLGLAIAFKSNLPGLLVTQRMKDALMQQGLAETKIAGLTVYKGYWNNTYTQPVPVCARVQDQYLFLTLSGQENYAETLITSIYK
jgi:hypothetical protein